MKQPKKAKLGVAGSMMAASGRTGIALLAIQAAKNAGCPAIKQQGRVDCDELLEWFIDHPDILSANDDGTIATEELLDKRAVRRTRELKLELMQGEVMPTDEAIMEISRVIVSCKVTLLGGIQSLALKIAADTGGDQIQIAERARAWAMEALKELSKSKFETVCPHCRAPL